MCTFFAGEPLSKSSATLLESDKALSKKKERASCRPSDYYEVNHTKFIEEELQNRPSGYPIRGEIFEIIATLNSRMERYPRFSETTKDLSTIYNKCVRQACIRPRCWMSKRQTIDVLYDIVNGNMTYSVLYYVTTDDIPQPRSEISLDVIDRLLSVYKGSDKMRLDSELSGDILSIKGYWSEMEELLKKKGGEQSGVKDSEKPGENFEFTWTASQADRQVSSNLCIFYFSTLSAVRVRGAPPAIDCFLE